MRKIWRRRILTICLARFSRFCTSVQKTRSSMDSSSLHGSCQFILLLGMMSRSATQRANTKTKLMVSSPSSFHTTIPSAWMRLFTISGSSGSIFKMKQDHIKSRTYETFQLPAMDTRQNGMSYILMTGTKQRCLDILHAGSSQKLLVWVLQKDHGLT